MPFLRRVGLPGNAVAVLVDLELDLEAKRETRTKVQEAGQLVEANLGDGLLTGKPAAVGAVDDVVVARVLSSSIVRVKIWSADGRVLYSDDPAQIGGRYALDAGQRRLLREGGAKVEVSDLSRPENALDRGPRAADRGVHADPDAVRGRRCCSRSTSASARSRRARGACSRRSPRRSSARSD